MSGHPTPMNNGVGTSKTRMNNGVGTSKRVFLIQVREREDVRAQEHRCFVDRCGLDSEQLESVSIVHEAVPSWERVSEFDAVMIGGAGIYTATQEYEFTQPMVELVRKICDEGMPLFGACWGHQFIARVLGGSLVTDESRAEVGTHEVELTAAGMEDPLFAGFPQRILANMGHHDHVDRLPEGGVELATSALSRNQAFRITGRPIYGTQFHVEMTAPDLVERLAIYQDIYMPEDDEFDALRENPLASPEADQILRRFMDHFVAEAV